MIATLGMYRPRDTPLHHAPTWFKVVMLLAVSITTIVIDDAVTSVGIMCAALLMLASTHPPLASTLRAMLATLIVAAISAGLHLWRQEWDRAIDLAADLIAIVALALAVTCSTSMESMLDFVSKAARPIRFILPPETLGLMFALMLRAIPEVARLYTESRMAARARGFDRSIRAVVYPTTTRTVGFSLQLGQALHARGIAEEARLTRKQRKELAEAEQRRARRMQRARAEHESARDDAADMEAAGSALAAATADAPEDTSTRALTQLAERERSRAASDHGEGNAGDEHELTQDEAFALLTGAKADSATEATDDAGDEPTASNEAGPSPKKRRWRRG